MRRSYGLQTLLIGCLVAMAAFMPTLTPAQDDAKVTKAMEILKAKTAALGAPKLDGTDGVEGKVVPALYFGTTTGQLWIGRESGEKWECLFDALPPIHNVKVAVV